MSASAPSGLRQALGLAAMDLGPLRRRREFRLLWIGQGVSFFGSMITYVALPYQAYHPTRSSLVVGLLGLAELVPLLGAAIVGGALADAFDRRRMMQITELSFAVGSLSTFRTTLGQIAGPACPPRTPSTPPPPSSPSAPCE
jgi:MFS family permease